MVEFYESKRNAKSETIKWILAIKRSEYAVSATQFRNTLGKIKCLL